MEYIMHLKGTPSQQIELMFWENWKGCWIPFSHKRDSRGRVKVKRNYQNALAHRYIYELNRGKIPEGKVLCHSCDVDGCCNPDHMFVATQLDNVRDCIKKGRYDHTHQRYNNAKVTDDQVREIKTSNASSRILAIKYGLNYRHVERIIRGKSRKYVTV
jgi:hypothetical protein